MKLIFCLFSLFLSLNIAFGQTKEDDLQAMFDDGNISTSKNLVKVNPTAFIAGDLPIFYERVISDVVGVEIGIGYLIDMKSYEFTLAMEEFGPERKGSGYSIWLNPRIYFGGEAPEGYYLGLLYRRRSFSSGFLQNDFSMNNGFQFGIKDRLLVDIMYGLGLRFIEDPAYSTGSYELDVDIVLPFGIKLGYLF